MKSYNGSQNQDNCMCPWRNVLDNWIEAFEIHCNNLGRSICLNILVQSYYNYLKNFFFFAVIGIHTLGTLQLFPPSAVLPLLCVRPTVHWTCEWSHSIMQRTVWRSASWLSTCHGDLQFSMAFNAQLFSIPCIRTKWALHAVSKCQWRANPCN